jgi:hypothetical protein
MNVTNVTEEQKKAWTEKYGQGNCYELIADGKSVFVFDPCTDFKKIKIVYHARQKSVSHMVDAILNNCWLGGDTSLKDNEAFKQGIEDQVDNLLNIPEAEKEELDNGNVLIKIEGVELEVKKVTRADKRYVEERNADGLMKRVYLLERIAVDSTKLDALKAKPAAYFSALLEVMELKEKKDVELKKF